MIHAETSPESFLWSDAMLVGQGEIDLEHREFVRVVGALQACNGETASARLSAVLSHLLAHFDIEESWMERLEFPATQCHCDEHRKVLDAVSKVHDLAAVGAVALSDIKRLAKALIDWFPAHADYMDSALATWISKKTHGGTPIVLRRGLELHSA
jgi:hemerythrin-like metal-binding protein